MDEENKKDVANMPQWTAGKSRYPVMINVK